MLEWVKKLKEVYKKLVETNTPAEADIELKVPANIADVPVVKKAPWEPTPLVLAVFHPEDKWEFANATEDEEGFVTNYNQFFAINLEAQGDVFKVSHSYHSGIPLMAKVGLDRAENRWLAEKLSQLRKKKEEEAWERARETFRKKYLKESNHETT